MSLLESEAIIFSQPHGGLGDNLLYSTLPERFAALGKPFYIARQNVVRSQNAFDLVWGLNPHVRGIADEAPNAGDSCYARYAGSPKIMNIISRIEAAHGIEPVNLAPKLYYTPKWIDELADKVIIDVNSTTVGFSPDSIRWYLTQIFEWYRYDKKKTIQIELESSAVVKNIVKVDGFQSITLRDIYHYCDIIHSCRAFVTVHSGAHCLAAALRQQHDDPQVMCMVSRDFYNARLAVFPKVEYFVV